MVHVVRVIFYYPIASCIVAVLLLSWRLPILRAARLRISLALTTSALSSKTSLIIVDSIISLHRWSILACADVARS